MIRWTSGATLTQHLDCYVLANQTGWGAFTKCHVGNLWILESSLSMLKIQMSLACPLHNLWLYCIICETNVLAVYLWLKKDFLIGQHCQRCVRIFWSARKRPKLLRFLQGVTPYSKSLERCVAVKYTTSQEWLILPVEKRQKNPKKRNKSLPY